jgi:acyl-CoA synthetase (AMP-forming)/AMP-acid ligase II
LNNEKLTSLENITIGTERMPASKLKEAVEFFGTIIYVGYGMVEALPPVAMLGPREYCRARCGNAAYNAEGVKIGPFGERSLQKIGFDSVGRISKGVEVEILEDGRIAVKSKTVSLGYLDNPEENAKCFKDGWFYTNDYGTIDGQGYLHILGRKEDILRESPRRIFAQEIEDRVYALSFVNRCACVARDGKIVVFVSLRGKIDEQEMKAEILRCAQDDASGLSSQDISIVIKESLPINYAGKLDKKRLLDNYMG